MTTSEIRASDLVLCESADGWSLHAPDATDDQIADGDAPYLVSGEGTPTEADYAEALRVLREANSKNSTGFRVEVRGDFGGGSGGWRPAITGTLNQTSRDDMSASTFPSEEEASEAAHLVLSEGASADDVRVIAAESGAVIAECDVVAGYRVFQGRETEQVRADGSALDPHAWYFEPTDYEGDVVFAAGFATRDEARLAAANHELASHD